MAAPGGGARVQVHGRVSLRQTLHPFRQKRVLPGHPARRQGRALHHIGVKVRQDPGVIGLEDVLHAGGGRQQHVPLLRGRHGRQPLQKSLVHPLAQDGGHGGGLVEKRPEAGGLGRDQEKVERQAQPQERPQRREGQELFPLIHRKPHRRPSSR